jgi:ferredoxin
MRITVDQDKCLGSGNCVFSVGEVFDQDEDGVVVALQTSPPAELDAKVREAADLCPSHAITVLED